MRGTHLDYLDGWRGLAIALLLLGHFFPVPGINFGSVGVNFFFVLSGYLMARLLFIQETPIPVFYKRRISRIVPAHWLFLVIITTTFIAANKEVRWSEVITAALFVNNYFPGEVGKGVMPFGHIWSLSVEEHSYILLSVIAIAARRKLLSPIVAVGSCCLLFALCGVLYWMNVSGNELHFRYWLHSEVSAYGIFISAFFLLCFRKHGIPHLPLVAFPVLIVAGLALHWWSVPLPITKVFGVGAFALAVNLLAEAPQTLKTVLSFAPLRQLGVWSFSIYLWQQPFYLYAHREGLSKWLALAMAMLTGIASFYLFEKPIRKYLNRVWANEKAPDSGKANTAKAIL